MPALISFLFYAYVDFFSFSATYFFGYFLLAAYPNSTVAPFGNAFVCLAFSKILPPLAPHIISNKITKGQVSFNFNPRAAACTTVALTLLWCYVPHVLPPTISLSNYMALHYAIGLPYKIFRRVRKYYPNP